MKRSEAIKKIREAENTIEVERAKRLRKVEAAIDLENLESSRNRARAITVGTAFGGTTEILMRSDGGRHLWCAMQPVEVIELINQLAANVGCNIALKPRDDFASWRDWRVSDAEKKHLNGHVPFANDMAVFQQLGASGYNDEEAKKIMAVLANVKSFTNESDETKILSQETKIDGGPHLMIGEEDGLLHNKVVLDNDEVVYMAGGDGGRPNLTEVKHVATTTPIDGRKPKRTPNSSR